MVADEATGELQPFNFEHLREHIPELSKFDFRIDVFSFDEPIDSSNMKPEIWVDISKAIQDNYELYDGFVVLHGSDTMAYTASALSFMLENLSKPVILTGSQLPIGVIRTDGKENIITAIEIAAACDIEEKPIVPEVAIYFENKLYRGNRTQKYNADHFEAFDSPNYPLLAHAGVDIEFKREYIRQIKQREELIIHEICSQEIAVLDLFPGITPTVVESVLEISGLQALVLKTFGSGNAPSDQWFIDLLDKKIREGLIVYNITQCSKGRVEQGRYSTSAFLQRIGVISGSGITKEAAVTKLMYLLSKDLPKEEVEIALTHQLRGEM